MLSIIYIHIYIYIYMRVCIQQFGSDDAFSPIRVTHYKEVNRVMTRSKCCVDCTKCAPVFAVEEMVCVS
jgi:hypothetical protein